MSDKEESAAEATALLEALVYTYQLNIHLNEGGPDPSRWVISGGLIPKHGHETLVTGTTLFNALLRYVQRMAQSHQQLEPDPAEDVVYKALREKIEKAPHDVACLSVIKTEAACDCWKAT
jgi:hypothetical protein